MAQISPTCTTADLEKAAASLGRLSHMNPAELWAFIGIAKSNVDNDVFWQSLHDCLVQQGASVVAADVWVRGMKSLSAGKVPA